MESKGAHLRNLGAEAIVEAERDELLQYRSELLPVSVRVKISELKSEGSERLYELECGSLYRLFDIVREKAKCAQEQVSEVWSHVCPGA